MTDTRPTVGDTARRYRHFADAEARGHSPTYQALAQGVSGDAELVALIDQLPRLKRQPNLLLATVRFLGGPVTSYALFRAWTVEHWSRVARTMLERRTQTNEPGRCATLLPLLAILPQPLALIEVGASAGLCLYPDRYHHRYDDGPGAGPEDSPVSLICRTSGPVPLPDAVPAVVWRALSDLHPLDVFDALDVRWLECLVWPGQDDRLRRLRGAIQVARDEPARLVRGDLNDTVVDLVGQAPPGSTPVVFHSAVLAYLPVRERLAFAETIRDLPCHWISNEAPSVLPSIQQRLGTPAQPDRTTFALALDGRPVAFSGPHGESLDWFAA